MTTDIPAAAGAETDPATLTPDPDAGVMRAVQARRVHLRRILALATLAITIVLGAIGWWTHLQVEESMRATRGDALKSVLHSQAKSLGVWIDDQKLGIQRLARDRRLRKPVEAITGLPRDTAEAIAQNCRSSATLELIARIEEALAGGGTAAFNVIDSSAVIIASNQPGTCGLRYRAEAFAKDLAPVFAGESVFVPPHLDAANLQQAPQPASAERPLIWIRAPLRNSAGDVIAALAAGYLVEDQFSTILAAARAGETDEVYLFDRSGTMLSKSRFETTLQERGMLAGAASSVARLQLRPPLSEDNARTQLVEAALAARADQADRGSMLLDPYPGYLATPVVGGWRSLTGDLFIGIEMSADEAYAPLQTLDTVFAVVFAALIAAVCVALFSWVTAALIRAEVEKDRMGPYWLGERIGEGGVGNVYHARHDLLKRPSAVKLLKPARATDEMTARFRREAKLASQLTHPNMIEIYDYGVGIDGSLFFAMELLEGDTVGELVLRGGPMPVARALHILRQVCAGLAEVHGKGLVHRDISVTNIMSCLYGGEYDFVKILDFGLVKNVVDEQSQTVTRSLRILGTVQYMAPERLHNPSDVDARTDVYALGAVAFFLLSGRRMFETKDTLALTTRVINEVPPRLSEIADQPIPGELDDLVAACLEKSREDRPENILAVKKILDRLAEHERWSQEQAKKAWEAQHEASGAAS